MKILLFLAAVAAFGMAFRAPYLSAGAQAAPAVSSPTGVRWDGGVDRPGRTGVTP